MPTLTIKAQSELHRLLLLKINRFCLSYINCFCIPCFRLFPSLTDVLIFCFSCDADPSALAKYVVALVKKDKSEKELRALCVDQLDVFLQKGNEQLLTCVSVQNVV